LLRFVVNRLVHLVIVLLLVSFFTAALIDLIPGEPAYVVLGDTATPEQVASFNEEFGLNDPFPERYARWLGDLVQGDLGTSMRTQEKVTDLIKDRLPVTLEIGLLGLIMAILIAIPVGVYAAYRQGGWFDNISYYTLLLLIATPSFILALFISQYGAVELGLFPVTGWVPFSQDLTENLRFAFLPALTLAVTEAAVFSRLLRSDMISTLQEDFILSAKAEGLPPKKILFKYALKPSSFTLVTLVGLSIGRLLGGAVIVEQLFGLPGLGRLLYQSILAKDVSTVQGLVMFLALAYVVMNTIVDLSYHYLDPRVRSLAKAA
jgi:peptide/nickel transport system permease protein